MLSARTFPLATCYLRDRSMWSDADCKQRRRQRRWQQLAAFLARSTRISLIVRFPHSLSMAKWDPDKDCKSAATVAASASAVSAASTDGAAYQVQRGSSSSIIWERISAWACVAWIASMPWVHCCCSLCSLLFCFWHIFPYGFSYFRCARWQLSRGGSLGNWNSCTQAVAAGGWEINFTI